VSGSRAGAGQPLTSRGGRRFFCSWSGGKDSYLALARAVAAGGQPTALLTMLCEDGQVSRGHGLPVSVVAAQAAALGLPLVTRPTTWDGYRIAFLDALAELRAAGVQAGVFGDIDLQGHRDWVEDVCGTAGLAACLPLWRESRARLLTEFLASGARATVVAVDAARLPAGYLGRELDDDLLAELVAEGVDASGEAGEYHTAVTAAPLFDRPVALDWHGIEERDGHWVLCYAAETA